MALTLNGTTGIVTPGVTDTGNLSVAGTTALTTPLPVTSGGTGATSLSSITVGTATNATNATTATNLAAGSAGTVPYQSASGTTAMLAAGTSGQVLTSSGAGAPTWTTPSAGAMTLISTSTVSNAASVAFTGITSAYSSYMIVLLNVYNTGSGGYPLAMQVSTDNSTYLTSNYFWADNTNNARFSQSGSSGQSNAISGGSYDSRIYISNNGSGGSGSVAPVTGDVRIFNPGGGAQATVFHSRMTGVDSTPTFSQDITFGFNTTTSAIQAVKFFFNTGNIWGTFKLYGIT